MLILGFILILAIILTACQTMVTPTTADKDIYMTVVVPIQVEGEQVVKIITPTPEPTTLPAAVQAQHTLALAGQAPMPEVYAHANYLWYAYSGIGVLSFLALLVFIFVTDRIDSKKAAVA